MNSAVAPSMSARGTDDPFSRNSSQGSSRRGSNKMRGTPIPVPTNSRPKVSNPYAGRMQSNIESFIGNPTAKRTVSNLFSQNAVQNIAQSSTPEQPPQKKRKVDLEPRQTRRRVSEPSVPHKRTSPISRSPSTAAGDDSHDPIDLFNAAESDVEGEVDRARSHPEHRALRRRPLHHTYRNSDDPFRHATVPVVQANGALLENPDESLKESEDDIMQFEDEEVQLTSPQRYYIESEIEGSLKPISTSSKKGKEPYEKALSTRNLPRGPEGNAESGSSTRRKVAERMKRKASPVISHFPSRYLDPKQEPAQSRMWRPSSSLADETSPRLISGRGKNVPLKSWKVQHPLFTETMSSQSIRVWLYFTPCMMQVRSPSNVYIRVPYPTMKQCTVTAENSEEILIEAKVENAYIKLDEEEELYNGRLTLEFAGENNTWNPNLYKELKSYLRKQLLPRDAFRELSSFNLLSYIQNLDESLTPSRNNIQAKSFRLSAIPPDVSLGSRFRTPNPVLTRSGSSRMRPHPESGAEQANKEHETDPDEVILVYPPSGTGAVNITKGLMKRLHPGEFLNDTLIEFGLKFWLNGLKQRHPSLAEDIYVFNSFFYRKLRGKSEQDGYQSVRKWTAKIDVFQKKYLIVPINENVHWYLAIICHPERVLRRPIPQPEAPRTRGRKSAPGNISTTGDRVLLSSKHVTGDELKYPPHEEDETEPDDVARVVESTRKFSLEDLDTNGAVKLKVLKDLTCPDQIVEDQDQEDHIRSADGSNRFLSPLTEEKDNTAAKPQQDEMLTTYIFTFDSMGSRHPQAIKTLQRYLADEAKDKKSTEITRPAKGKNAIVPCQPNFCDCGVYLLHFAKTFVSEADRYTTLILDNKKLNSQDIQAIWRNDLVANVRDQLRADIETLSVEWKSHTSRASKLPETMRKSVEDGQPSEREVEDMLGNRQSIVPDSEEEVTIEVVNDPKRGRKRP